MAESEFNTSEGVDVTRQTELGQLWTMANVLSMTRLVIVVPVAYLIVVEGPLRWILGLLILALTTDYFDGRVARWSHSVSNWGKLLDPFADKIGGIAVVSALAYIGKLPVWFLVVIFVRDVLIIIGGEIIRRRSGAIGVSILSGKLAVSVVAITVLAALLQADPPEMEFLLISATVLLVFSYLRYLRRFFNMYSSSNSERESGVRSKAAEG